MKSTSLAMAVLAMAGAARAAPPPAEAFGRLPAVAQVAISPNGQHVGILGSSSGQVAVSIATIDDPNIAVTPMGRAEAVSLGWAGDDFLLARVAVWLHYDARLDFRMERTVALNPQGKQVSVLLSNDDTSSRWSISQPVVGVSHAPTRAYVLGLAVTGGPEGSTGSLIARKGEDSYFVRALFSVDPATGKGKIIERGDFDTYAWEVDNTGQPRVRLAFDDITHRFTAFARAKGQSTYRPVIQGDFRSRAGYRGYSDPDDAIYRVDNDRVVRLRLATGAVEPVGQPLQGFQPRLLWDANLQTPVAIYKGGEKMTADWLDPQLASVDASLSKVFKGKELGLEDWSADRSRFVLRVESASSPATWYLFDRTRKELSPLGEEYPELKGAAFGATRWVTYKARDGLEISGYLTLPPGAPAQGAKAPLVVMPHGGPAARDDSGFDFMVQFLATRGYAVLRPQFRGSRGFGDAFQDAGRGEWGGKMQTDLLDGIAAVAASGDIDPNRVCIFGASFGGYAAMAGATLHPDAYKCAASFAGISDLGLFLIEKGRVYGADSGAIGELRADLGLADKGKLEATSPARHAADLKIPLLLMHGDQDTVVALEQSQVMAKAAAGRPVELVVLAGENHYLSQASTRTQMLKTLEAFLAKNLPVTAP